MPKYLNINSFGLKKTMGAEVKRFTFTLKTSTHHPKALISVVSKSYRAAISFLRNGSWILKRLRIDSVVTNYTRHIQMIYLTMPTYTFNYYQFTNDNVKGEIRKKMLQNRSTRYNSKLAPKFYNFSTIPPCISSLIHVNSHKNEYYNLLNYIIPNKNCEVSLDTVLFIKRMNKIEDHRSSLYKVAFSTNNLLTAYYQIKSKAGDFTPEQRAEASKDINLK